TREARRSPPSERIVARNSIACGPRRFSSMNLLGAKLYDPAAAVSKATSSLLAMTALDTTNLRLTVTVPAHGMLRFRLCGTITGATTFPTILLGVLNGATVVGRMAPVQSLGNTAVATADINVEADFIVTGLTPG